MKASQKQGWFLAALAACIIGFVVLFVMNSHNTRPANPLDYTPTNGVTPTPANTPTAIPTHAATRVPTATVAAAPTVTATAIPSRTIYDPNTFTAVRVIRTITYKKSGAQPIDHTVTDKQTILDLYNAVMAVPVTDIGGVMCAVNYGSEYEFIFMRNTTPVVRMQYDEGCSKMITINGTERRDGLKGEFDPSLNKIVNQIYAGAI